MKALLAGLMFVCTSASAQYQNGNALYSDLISTTTSWQMFALGYVVGVTDAFIGKELCVPKDVTQGQLSEVVTNFLAGRPQLRHHPADLLVLAALGQHWACKERTKS